VLSQDEVQQQEVSASLLLIAITTYCWLVMAGYMTDVVDGFLHDGGSLQKIFGIFLTVK